MRNESGYLVKGSPVSPDTILRPRATRERVT